MIRVLTVFVSLLFPLIASADCIPTVERSPGMHYKPVSEFQQNTGKGLRFRGLVRAAGDCKAIAGAKVGHWQANGKGQYDDDHRAYVLTNHVGIYSFNTDWPAASEGRPPHVYFIVIAKGYKTLITRWDSDNTKTAQVNLDLVLQPEASAQPVNPAQ
jgi:protocatechuate 3,4-dioxygenase beta subunit